MARYEIMHVGIDKEFIQYTSPTVILGQLSKGDALIQWSADMAVNYIKDTSEYRTKDDQEAFIVYGRTVFSNAQYAWKKKRDNTADIGSELHALVETYINLRLNRDIDKVNEFMDHVKTLDINLKNMFYQFIVWQRKNVKRFIESEKQVVHTELCYAGTLDFTYEGFDNKIYCVDLKTSNAIYKEHEIQIVSYKYARESMTGSYIIKSTFGDEYDKTIKSDSLKIDKCAILNISRDFFTLVFKIVRDEEYKQKSFEALLSHFYISAKRRLNNKRAKARA